jgi:hypothetical protein
MGGIGVWQLPARLLLGWVQASDALLHQHQFSARLPQCLMLELLHDSKVCKKKQN